MIFDFFILAFKSLKKRPLRIWLTMLGIFIGVSLVISLVSLGQGLQNAVNSQFSAVGVDKIIVQPVGPGYGPPGQEGSTLTDKDLRVIEQVVGVKTSGGRIISSSKIEYNKIVKINFIASMPKEQKARDLIEEAQNLKIYKGRFLKQGDSKKAVIGNNYATKKIFDKNLEVGNKILIGGESFEIIGILKKIGNPMSDEIVLINQEDIEDITGKTDYSALFIQVEKGSDVNSVADKITRALRKKKGQKEGHEDFEVQTTQELIESFNTILIVIQMFVIGIAGISLVVGGIGIMNTMYTSVLERTREIGIMKAIGAKNSGILKLFLIESGMIGLVGGAVGLLLGMGFSLMVEFGAKQALGSGMITASFPVSLLIGTLLFSFILGAISGVFPAMQAAKMKPVDALRK